MDWSKARCWDIEDRDLFFPEFFESHKAFDAKKICYKCPIITKCFDYAVEDPSLYGIWGGSSYRERVLMRNYGIKPKRYGEIAS